ncbi:ATP-dependent nuclease [Bacillus thuringiensis]|uniref:ATP-dependent nuclease n=1 Tax=Bacillus thuringiensis TaxID=1428 RepID=UPI0011A96F76|nr:AAA family ATPase [Bacillus thuringiensis]
MYIERMTIKNYKSIKYEEIDFSYLNCLVGQNNAGKSTIIDAIQCFYGKKVITNEDHHLRNKEPVEIEIFFSHSYTEKEIYNLLYESEIENEPDNTLTEMFNEVTRTKNAELAVKRGYLRFKLKREYNSKQGNELYTNFYDSPLDFQILKTYLPHLYVIPAVRNPEMEVKAQDDSVLGQLLSLILSGTQDIQFIKVPNNQIYFSYNELKELLLEHIQKMIDQFIVPINNFFQANLNTDTLSLKMQMDFASDTSTEYRISTFLVDKHFPSQKIDILSCGTGLQNVVLLSIMQASLQEHSGITNAVLLFEEPEIYLHPSLQRKMIITLKNLSRNNQIFLTTHSPIIVSKVDQQEILHITKDKLSGQTSVSHASARHIIEDLGIQPSDIFNKNHIIFVEGNDDKIIIEELIHKITKNTTIFENQIAILDIGGFDKMEFYANANILTKNNVKSNYWIIVDSDGEDAEKRREKIVRKSKINGIELQIDSIFVLNHYAIESYFLDPILLNHTFPKLKLADLKEITEGYFNTYQRYHDLVIKQGLIVSEDNKPTINKRNFKQYFKPKLMFYNDDIKKMEVALKLYKCKNELKFEQIRTQLVESWANTVDNPIKLLINSNSLSDLQESRMGELVDILKCILDKLDTDSHVHN